MSEFDYICEELWGNQYVRLLRYPQKQGFDICLITQHFHVIIGRYSLEIDW